ncbi:unnamed protein product [Lota lota]
MAGMMRGVDPRMLLLLILLSPMFGKASSGCSSRRCLAQALTDRKAMSQPQNENCTQHLMVPFIEYQTLSVDMMNLRFTSQLKANMEWMDPELAWNKSEYGYEMVVLPVDSVWTPGLMVTNAMSMDVLHGSKDLLVYSNGTVKHTLSLNVVVNCEVNLFKYPFSNDWCPVAIEAWTNEGCGMELNLQDVYLVDGNQGEWRTDYVAIHNRGYGQHFIMVALSTKSMNPFISLILPSVLILFLDVVSFTLPLGGGERNSFKVTLALSFIMFLLILNSLLPGDSQCSPILRSHFCVCLVFLVVSMTASMLLTRVVKDGFLIPCVCIKKTTSTTSEASDDRHVEDAAGDEESKADATELGRPTEDSKHLRKVVDFLDAINAENKKSETFYSIASKLDKMCFYIYLVICIVYFALLTYMFTSYPCEVDHFSFWY